MLATADCMRPEAASRLREVELMSDGVAPVAGYNMMNKRCHGAVINFSYNG